MFLCFFAVKPTVIHTDMFVNSIGPVNAINMVSKGGAALHNRSTQIEGRCRCDEESCNRYLLRQPVQLTTGLW